MRPPLLGVLVALLFAAPAGAQPFRDALWRPAYPVTVERCDMVFDAYGGSRVVCYTERWCRGSLKRPRGCTFDDPAQGGVRKIR